MQLGFDLDYTDPVTHKPVPWAEPTPELLTHLHAAAWKSVDTETTGLNPASNEQKFANKQYQRGVDPTLRLRVVSALFPCRDAGTNRVVAFDMDQLTPKERSAVVRAAFSKAVFAHNAGFDAYWLRSEERSARPDLLIDTMLLGRALFPQQPLVLAHMSMDEDEDYELREAALSVFAQSRSGWSLADLVLSRLRRIMDKGRQGPKNWCEPFLPQASYDYATGDVVHLYDLIVSLLAPRPGESILDAYLRLRADSRILQLLEPQVLDVVSMREKGFPWSPEVANAYIRAQHEKAANLARELVQMEPTLMPFEASLADPRAGINAGLKEAVGKAFSARGLELAMTEKTSAFKVGEKDLRKVKAAASEATQALFQAWVGVNRAKKAAGMATEVTGFATRSPDGRLHPNTGHGPVTGRLSSSEPNAQQFPRDQGFRNAVEAPPGYLMLASDYSALDMRVGGALAIRAQLQIAQVHVGERRCDPDVAKCIALVLDNRLTLELARKKEAINAKTFEAWKQPREVIDEMSKDTRKKYWEGYRRLRRSLQLAHFSRCLAEVTEKARAAGTSTWGSLRNAFSIPGMDIHTWTAVSMQGEDPLALFGGLSDSEVAARLKAKKKDLGDMRQAGKVGNLSLLYAMKAFGLQEAAAKNYDIHWSIEEAEKVRNDWLAAYVEIDLWHAWTELNPVDSVQVPDPDRGGRLSRKDVFCSRTLAEREVYAFGLNAALSYEDQSSGADILGDVMAELRTQHNPIFHCVVNQVHDEVVFEVPEDRAERYTEIVGQVMNQCAERYLMPYGVKGECSPAIGKVWLKD